MKENIEKALLSRAFTQPSACEVVWSPSSKYMLVGSTSTKTIDSFLEHFEKHFALYPEPLYHASWAINFIRLDESQRAALNPMVSLQFPEAVEQGRSLGYDFLTWLWSFTESGEGIIHFGEERQAVVHLGERHISSLGI